MTAADSLLNVGPYDILEELARGGMGQVYRGRHEETGAEVILKVPLEHAFARKALERESEALTELEHPNIVRMVARGESWLALEPVTGSRLSVAHSGCVVPGEFERRLEPLVGLCHALAHLHGLGWVHADLSPNNMIVDESGHLTLIDLGLATHFGHRLSLKDFERAGMLAGTMTYTSPEGLEGKPLDARSDLYSLGCILYEQLTGVPPFRGTRDEVVHGHLYRKPARLPRSLPDTLTRLVTRLLSKAPGRRPGHAFAVLEELVACGVPASLPPRPARPYLTLPTLLGVDTNLQEWEAVLSEGRPQSWAVVGPPGSGKSSLAYEMIRRARIKGLEVLLVPTETSGGEVLGVFSGLLPAQDTPLDAFKAAERLREKLGASGEKLLVVEDAERLSQNSRTALEHLLTHESPWLLVCSRDAHDVEHFEHVQRIQPLDASHMRTLTRSALGGLRVPNALDMFIEARARGNPWLVLEHLRALLKKGLLTFDNTGAYRLDLPEGTLNAELEQLPTPEAVAEVLQELIERLTPTQRSACVFLAVAGRALPRTSFPNARALEEMLEARLMRVRGDKIEWSNPSMGDAVLAATPKEHQERWHAHMLDHDDLDDADMARHLEAMGRRVRASRAYERAGEAAVSSNDLNMARRHLLAALSLSDDTQRSFELTARVIDKALLPSLLHEQAFELVDALRSDLTPALAPHWHLMRADVLLAARQPQKALEEIKVCESMLDLGNRHLTAKMHATWGGLCLITDHREDARRHLNAAIDLFREFGEPERLANGLLNLGVLTNLTEEFEATLEALNESRDIFESLGYHNRVHLVSQVMSFPLRTLGQFGEALRLLRDAARYHHRHGSYARESSFQLTLATCLYDMGLIDEAWRLFEQLANRRPPYCRAMESSIARFGLARIASVRGEVASARVHLDAFTLFCSEPHTAQHARPIPYLEALLAAERGETTEAMELLDAALEDTPEWVSVYIRPTLSRLTARTLYICGEHERLLEHVKHEFASIAEGATPQTKSFWGWLRACVKFSRGTLEALEFDEPWALWGEDRLMSARMGLLKARFMLERGALESARALMEHVGEICERENLVIELLTLWRLEAMMASVNGEDEGFALEELEALKASLPPELPELAWWPPSPFTS